MWLNFFYYEFGRHIFSSAIITRAILFLFLLLTGSLSMTNPLSFGSSITLLPEIVTLVTMMVKPDLQASLTARGLCSLAYRLLGPYVDLFQWITKIGQLGLGWKMALDLVHEPGSSVCFLLGYADSTAWRTCDTQQLWLKPKD